MSETGQFHGSEQELRQKQEYEIAANLQPVEYGYLEDSLNRWKSAASQQRDDARLDGWRLGDVDYFDRVIATIDSLQKKLLTGSGNRTEAILLPHEYKYLFQKLEESLKRDKRLLDESKFDRVPADDYFERIIATVASLREKLKAKHV